MLSPISILLSLLLAGALVSINNFCLQRYRNLNYSLILLKFKRIVTKLRKTYSDLRNHDPVDVELQYLKLVTNLLKFSKITLSNAKNERSRDDHL